jgi:hypothetical protein
MLVADVAVSYLHLDSEHRHVRGCRTSGFQLETLKTVCWVIMVNCRSQMQGMHCMPERQLREYNFQKIKKAYVRWHFTTNTTFSYIQPSSLTLILLMWRIWWASNNASRWQMGFNSVFKGLKSDLKIVAFYCRTCTSSRKVTTHQDVHSWLFFLLSFPASEASETSLGPIKPPIQWIHLGIKWLGHEAGQSYTNKSDIHDLIYTSYPTIFMACTGTN